MASPGPLCFLALFAFASALHPADIVAGSEQGRQLKLLTLVTGLGTEDAYEHARKPYPYNNPDLYVKKDALMNFTTNYEQGFLRKDGFFTPSDLKTSRDTASLVDLFYFAKDFETFHKVASWAKTEINPVQYLHAVTSAVLLREDTSDLVLPPVYEVLPNYFVPSTIIFAAYRSKLNGIVSRKFLFNNTGWEQGSSLGYGDSFEGYDKNDFNYESALAYYREDVSRSEFFFKYFKKMDVKMNDEKKYGFKLERLKEWYYTAFKWILTRYNVERFALGLPPVQPLSFDHKITTGYDPEIADVFGQKIATRPDNIIPSESDPKHSEMIARIVRELWNDVEDEQASAVRRKTGQMINNQRSANQTSVINSEIVHYPSLYFNMLSFIDRLSTAANNKFSGGILQNDLIRMRDPVYYQILAYIDHIIRKMEAMRKPYTKEELGFPGAFITDVTTSKLQTYFEYFDFDISNAVPGEGGAYVASQFRINHRPFNIELTVKSEVETFANVKIFLGPRTNTLNQLLSLNELRESFTLMDTFQVKLTKGETVVLRKPGQSELTSTSLRFHDIVNRIHKGVVNSEVQCYYPSHLLLPKGSSHGTPFKMLVIVYPSNTPEQPAEETRSCGRDHLTQDLSRTLPFPVDRYWLSSAVDQPNLKFFDVLIYHEDS